MMRGMFAAISGLKTHQVMLDVTANDIANVNTIGYKSARTTFKDALSQMQRGASGAVGTSAGSNAAQIGLGVQLASIDNLMSGGSLQSTGNSLDVAIQGDGFFRVGLFTAADVAASAVQAPAVATPLDVSNISYTRAGNFTRNQDGFLVTQDGYYVVGRNAAGQEAALQVEPGATGVAIGEDGALSYIPAGGGARKTVGYISLASFPNAAGLERQSNNRWIPSGNSGVETAGLPGTGGTGNLMAGAIEMSNVDLAQTFTSMITAQRGFQANSRVISTSDEMLQDLVNMKR
jgi:flagellar hook protein FlgE